MELPADGGSNPSGPKFHSKMQCEICGKHILDGKRVKIEGSIVVTCNNCAKCGELVSTINPYSPKRKDPVVVVKHEKKKSVDFGVGSEELVEGFKDIIRKKREKKKLKQEDLAKLINEPASMIHRIEIGKMDPSLDVARKLQRILDVQLLHKSSSEDIQKFNGKGSEEITLGDLVVIKKKKKKE